VRKDKKRTVVCSTMTMAMTMVDIFFVGRIVVLSFAA
jgi:hypothetical protein